MKKSIIALVIAVASTSAFSFGFLVKSWTQNNLLFCQYSNGAIKTLEQPALCPLEWE